MTVTVDNRHEHLRLDRRGLAAHLRRLLAELGRAGAGVDISLVGDAEIRDLNRRWRGIDDITDVLSFATGDDPDDPNPMEHLGDVVISLDTARRQALALAALVRRGGAGELWGYGPGQLGGRAPGRPPDPSPSPYTLRTEAFFLATHGVLHLLGHDHARADDAALMQALERRFMAPVTPLDPYLLDREPHGR